MTSKPENSLATKLKGIDASKLFSPEKIAQCQSMFDDAQAKFVAEALEQIEEIHKLHRVAGADMEKAEGTVKTISQQSHLLKGRMEALGYLFCYELANSLHNYTRDVKKYNATCMLVIGKHIDAIQAAIREDQAQDGGTIGKQMFETLKELVAKVKDL